MKRTDSAALLLMLAIAIMDMGAVSPSLAAELLPIRQDFESGRLDDGALAPCYRHENVLVNTADTARDGARAARLEVFPRGQAPIPAQAIETATARPSPSCTDPATPDAAYEDDGTERAELWEPSKARIAFGTEAWYGFSMRVDGTVPADDNRRLVIGQWKQSGGKSPFVAQRFGNRNFHITFQQDARNGNECRVLLAYQNEPPPQADSVDLTTGEPCQTDVVVERFSPLPSPFDAWTDLVYHIKGSAGTDGMLEVWADGALVARATGRIGYASAGKQYFKFGPYRDNAPYATSATIDSFARGSSFSEVASGLNRGAEGEIAARDVPARY